MNVARAYAFGVSTGSTLSFERRKSGSEADMKVGRVECRKATGAMDHGKVHEERVLRVDITDLGGWVDGVSMSFVLAMSNGAKIIPAIPAAETAIASEAIGAGEERISSPPTGPADRLMWRKRLGSGTANTAAKKERAKDVIVDRRMECTYVLLVPLKIPQTPSFCQSAERAAVREAGDLMFRA